MFPLDKRYIGVSNSTDDFLLSYENDTEIPIAPHPGAFGVVRKNHIHEGVDLYCSEWDTVRAISSGIVMYIGNFTGIAAGSPWWNDTQCILIRHDELNVCFNYGEVRVSEFLSVGDFVREGETVGYVKTVLRTNKGRPMNMLHLEAYSKETKEPIKEWASDSDKPDNLLDPTPYLIRAANANCRSALGV